MKASKRIISVFLCLALLVPIAAVQVFADTRSDIEELLATAKPLLYSDGTALSRRQLKANCDYAAALIDGGNASRTELADARTRMRDAVDAFEPAEPERVSVVGFGAWTAQEVSSFADTSGCAVMLENNATLKVVTAGKDTAHFSNAASDSAVIGASVFAGDISYSSGIRFKLSMADLSLAETFDVSVGIRGADGRKTFTVLDIPVRDGYVTIGWDYFTAEYDAVGSGMDASAFNYISFTFAGVKPGFIARISDFHCFRDDVITSESVEYSEKPATEFSAEKFYKLVERESGLALAANEHLTESTLIPSTDNRVLPKPSTLAATMAARAQTHTQEWQIYPLADGSFRLINRDNSLMLSASYQISYYKINFLNYKSNEYSFPVIYELGTDYTSWNFTPSDGGFVISCKGTANSSEMSWSNGRLVGNGDGKVWDIYECTYGDWAEVWGDEFDGNTVDDSKWTIYNGHHRPADEPIYFSNEPEYVHTENGELVIRSKVEDRFGWPITGVYMTTEGRFYMSYGKVEMRAKLPTGKWIFPALWMMGTDGDWPDCGEIDIMELVDEGQFNKKDLDARLFGTLHWQSDYMDGGTHYVKGTELYNENNESLGDAYHTYGLEWDNEQIRLYFDGMQYMSLNLDTDAMKWGYGDNPHYLILNTSARGPGDGNIFPDTTPTSEFDVDYIRVYKRRGDAAQSEVGTVPEAVVGTRTNSDIHDSTVLVASRDGSAFISSDLWGDVFKHDATNGKLLSKASNGSTGTVAIASESGKYTLVGTRGGQAYIYKDNDLKSYAYANLNGVFLEAADFSPDEAQIYIGGKNAHYSSANNKKLYVVSSASGVVKNDVDLPSDARVIATSPDGKYVAAGLSSGDIIVFTAQKLKAVRTIKCGAVVRGLKFLSDSTGLIASDELGNIATYDVETGETRTLFENPGHASVRRISISPDGSKLLTSSSDNSARLYDIGSGRLITLLGGFDGAAYDAEFSPDGNYIAVCSFDSTVRIYGSNGGLLFNFKATATDGSGTALGNIAFSGNSSSLMAVTTHKNASVYFWKLTKLFDKSRLYDALENANKLKREKYTPESYAKLTAALEACNPLLLKRVSSSLDITNAISAVNTAIKGLEAAFDGNTSINGFEGWDIADVAEMTASACKLGISDSSMMISENATKAFTVSSTSTTAWKTFNYTSGGVIAGQNPFGADLSNCDGISFWAKGLTKALSNGKVYIGYTGDSGSFLFSAAMPTITTTGLYVKIPFSDFVHESGAETLDLSRLNTIGFSGKGAKGLFAFSELAVYSEPGTEPVISGVEDGASYDITAAEPPKAQWDSGFATLDGVPYTAGTPITAEGEHTLSVTNRGTVKSVTFTVTDATVAPVVSGAADRQVFDLANGESASPAWNVGSATLNGESYSGETLDAIGEYTLTVTNGYKSETVFFIIVDTTGDTPPEDPEEPEIMKGDFDGDSEITVTDALAALRIAAKLAPETEKDIAIGDTDNDGHVTVTDALAILRVAAKLAESL